MKIALVDRHYLAGLFDGEGCAGVWKIKSRNYRDTPIVVVAMTDRRPVREYHKAFGGYFRDGFKKTPNGKPIYEWRVSHQAALRVACALIEYSRNPSKQKQFTEILKHYKEV